MAWTDDDNSSRSVGRRSSEPITTFAKKKPTSWQRFGRKLRLILGQTEQIRMSHPDAAEAVRALGLTQRQLRRLKMKFEAIDIDDSGTMDSAEFFEMLEEPRTPLTDALFRLIDLDGNGTIEFDEFVNVLMTYCVYSKEDILRFCFNCFDTDYSNAIDEEEFVALLSAVNNGAPLFPGNFRTALDQFDTNSDGLLDFDEFKSLDRHYPLVFFPAFRLQDQMQRKTLGESTWKRIHERINKQRYVDDYRKTHGCDPPISTRDSIKNVLFCRSSKELDIFAIDKRKPSRISHSQRSERNKKMLQGDISGRRKSSSTRSQSRKKSTS